MSIPKHIIEHEILGVNDQDAADALYVPYSGATTDLDMGAHNISGSIITGDLIIKRGGASTDFLKADGGIDSTNYAPVASLPTQLAQLTGDTTISSPSTDQVLKYNGSKWVNGAESTVNGGSGVDFFYDTTGSDIGGYDIINKSPQSIAEQDDTVVANNNTVLFNAYSSPSGGIGGTQIDAGVWTFDVYAYCSLLTLESHIKLDVYKRTTGGTETLLFSVNTPTIATTSLATVELYSILSIQQAFSINATDRIIVKVSGVTSNITNTTIHFIHGGTTHYSHFNTPLVIRHNDLAGLQGGTSGQYNHLTDAQVTKVDNSLQLDQSTPQTITGGLPNGFIPNYGTGEDGPVTINSNTTLTKDMNYTTLTIDSTGGPVVVTTAGWYIFAQKIIFLGTQGSIDRHGPDGGNGGNAAGKTAGGVGAAGTALAANHITTALAGGAGGLGGYGGQTGGMAPPPTVGSAGAAGTAVGSNLGLGGTNGAGGVAGNAGKVGGSGNAAGGAGGAGGTQSNIAFPYQATTLKFYMDWRTNTTGAAYVSPFHTASHGGSGGGSGGNSNSNNASYNGGGGGGGGAAAVNGGCMAIMAGEIIGTGTVSSIGGIGGNGGNGGDGTTNGTFVSNGGGAGSGGNGGSGGIIAIITRYIDSNITLISDGGLGGTAGTPGNGAGPGAVAGGAGTDGVAGNAGKKYTFYL